MSDEVSFGVFDHLCELPQPLPKDRDKIFSVCVYLQLMVGDFPQDVEEEVATDMLRLGAHTLRQARKVFPGWFD